MFSSLKKRDPFLYVRLKLFGINIGALLTIWVILLSLVYSLMTNELYNVLDNQLQGAAARIIHAYIRNQAKPANGQNITISGIGYSLWSLVNEAGTKTSFFIDGDPFVDVWHIYSLAVAHPNGYYVTVHDLGVPYRSFYALVHAQRGNYLIRVTTPTGPTDTTLGNLLWTLTEVGLAALALTIAVGMWLASRSLAPTIASWRRQQQFVADASHELRTPLAIIKTNLEVLLQHPDHTIESEIRYLGNAYEELVRTGSLIEDLLTLARADSHEPLIDKRSVNLTKLVVETVEAINPMALAQDKSVTALTPHFPCMTLGDMARLRQLLLVLIDNALRYSDAGASITVSLECDTLHSKIVVADTGFGIAPALLPKIFDRFVRGDANRQRNNQGSGLGLSIAKWIVDAHGGSIQVESALGKGTTVTITLNP